ncbi:hypothetical protein CONPUDRAFT_76744 [Coniophora puteana RWD-64-598 SS2]|uniref:Hydrophobin n=1 Tax=Coniophora puteana (strain RWD-64-598) TaxID=741705 RepID=A0A5M3MBX4_CONPW|nr:uncharacterized protein CONPUDRAFT_76744 [Coniophora puteana RWD-64-598 SS2]EIW76394.1 hypothetical protein CONPUDRAFT_76744 [Coniophora puteana RWD-64-598 SS2]
MFTRISVVVFSAVVAIAATTSLKVARDTLPNGEQCRNGTSVWCCPGYDGEIEQVEVNCTKPATTASDEPSCNSTDSSTELVAPTAGCCILVDDADHIKVLIQATNSTAKPGLATMAAATIQRWTRPSEMQAIDMVSMSW